MKSITRHNLEVRNRLAIHDSLKNWDIFSATNPEHYIEVTEWTNGEGFDICIESFETLRFKLTHGQFDALKFMINKLNKK
jgi:hypothetical protein